MKLKEIVLALALIVMAPMAATAAPAAQAVALPTGWVQQQAAGSYRFQLGDFRITVLSDGTAMRDLTKILSNPEKVRSQMAASHQPLSTELSINTYLIDTGAKKILVDTGAGELFGAGSGQLLTNLRAASYAPQDIDAILLTHIHGDHSGGLSIGGSILFPNATVYVDRRDPAYWLNADAEAQAPAARKNTFVQSHQTVDPYVKAGKLVTFDGATELFPGVRSVPEYGHTPGLSGYMIESGGQRLLLWGDVVHAADVQLRDPTITAEYDVDRAAAMATRQRLFDEAARQGYLVGGSHVSFPGLGHVRAEQSGYSWVAAPYSALLQK
jgi:glyoxylase-like metal-dependent hydrolase (beta-lactamase superfamily II)